jgi:hypothetical protein
LGGTSAITVADTANLHLLSANVAALGSTHELNSATSVSITNTGPQTQISLDLGDGVESISQFVFNGVDQGVGYFGSATFFASHPDLLTNPNALADESYFSGDGAISVPEPGTLSLIGIAGVVAARPASTNHERMKSAKRGHS